MQVNGTLVFVCIPMFCGTTQCQLLPLGLRNDTHHGRPNQIQDFVNCRLGKSSQGRNQRHRLNTSKQASKHEKPKQNRSDETQETFCSLVCVPLAYLFHHGIGSNQIHERTDFGAM